RPYRFQRPQAHDLKFAPGNAETAEFMDVPEAISLLMDRGRDGLAEDLRVSTDLHLERDAGIQLDDPLYVLEPVDRRAVQPHDRTARPQITGLCRAGWNDHSDFRGCEGTAGRHEESRAQHDREQEICRRPGRYDRCALCQWLMMEGMRPVLGRHGVKSARRVARRTGVPEHPHIPAEGNGAEPPARAVPIVPAEQFGAETDRKYLDTYAAAPSHPEMSHLMHEHEHGQDDQERDDVAEQKRHNGHVSERRRSRQPRSVRLSRARSRAPIDPPQKHLGSTPMGAQPSVPASPPPSRLYREIQYDRRGRRPPLPRSRRSARSASTGRQQEHPAQDVARGTGQDLALRMSAVPRQRNPIDPLRQAFAPAMLGRPRSAYACPACQAGQARTRPYKRPCCGRSTPGGRGSRSDRPAPETDGPPRSVRAPCSSWWRNRL